MPTKNVYLAASVRTPIGETAENLTRQYEISRDEQDKYALSSQQRAQAALESGRFDSEIVPLEIKGRKGEMVSFAGNEHARSGTTSQDLKNSDRPGALKQGELKD